MEIMSFEQLIEEISIQKSNYACVKKKSTMKT
jgi:hypothetical protein